MSPSRHFDEKRAYPANLCSLSCGVEFAGFGEDFGQSIGELIEAVSGMPSGSERRNISIAC